MTWEWQPCPTGKLAYPDRREAQRAMTRIRKRTRRSRTQQPVEAYRCSECQQWHLSSTPTRNPLRRTW